MIRRIMMLAVAAVLVPGMASTAAAQGGGAADEWMAGLRDADVRELSDREMQNLLGAMEEIEGMEGVDTDTPDMFEAIAANSEAKAILSRHDFEPAGFQNAVYNVVLAMGALAMQDQQAEIDQAMQQLEAMKDQLPEAQYQMLEEQVMGTVAMFRRAPASNVELVQKYQAELDALGE